ncbi:hypothetical protein [Stenotrophomonas sp. SAU14A_NAIMI4_8]|nr:hypothetical protein [Stenotrophomonas sp. SAU14A_NAIMI4_8]
MKGRLRRQEKFALERVMKFDLVSADVISPLPMQQVISTSGTIFLRF